MSFTLPLQKVAALSAACREFDVFLQIHGPESLQGMRKRQLTMVDGCKISSSPKTARWLWHCALGALLLAGPIPFAFAQGGQSEFSKTTPSNPPPSAPAPAPAAPAPAPAPVAAKPASPVGGPAWQTNVAQPPQPVPAPLQESDAQVIGKVNDYFNKLTDLQGTFLQTDPDGKQKRGKFYFQRPGKVRFDYIQPASLRIISDGKTLAIEDQSANTRETYPLDVTPFKLLLSEKVDLAVDAKILGVEQGPELSVLTVEDKNGDSAGRIRLFFNKADTSLKEWIVTDAQGLDTRIEVSEVEQNKKVAENLFIISAFGPGDR
jgi:outer membrane lipoprotein-sorting protein